MKYNRNVYVRDFISTDPKGRCSNCSTTHTGACPVAHVVARLARGNYDVAATIEAYVQARLLDERDRMAGCLRVESPAVVQGPAEPVAV